MKTYSHSGWAPPLGVMAALFAGAAIAIPCAFIYAYAFWYIPFVYLNILMTLGFGAVIGFAVAKAAEWGNVRNNVVVAGIALLAAIFGLYIYWGAYLLAVIGFARAAEVNVFAFLPWVVINFAGELFQKGSWGLGGQNSLITGWPLVAFWVGETIVVVGLALVVSQINSDRPFCESCREWTEKQLGVARLSGNGTEPAWTKVLSGELPALAEFPPSPPGAAQYVRLDLARCPRCEHSRFLSISAVTVSVDKEGKTSENTRSLATNAILTPAQCAVVEACGQLYQQNLEEQLGPIDSAEAGGPTATAEGES